MESVGRVSDEAHLPPASEPLKGLFLGIRGLGEELSVQHGVEQPFPVLLRD